VAIPVYVGDEHAANFFTGQFLFEKPDIEYFRKQALEFGFNETDYIRALEKIPVFTKDEINRISGFLINLTERIGEQGLQRIQNFEKNKQIEIQSKKLQDTNEELSKHRNHLEELVKERTAEVEEKNRKLSEQMKIFVGRELRIKDLESKIRTLKRK